MFIEEIFDVAMDGVEDRTGKHEAVDIPFLQNLSTRPWEMGTTRDRSGSPAGQGGQ